MPTSSATMVRDGLRRLESSPLSQPTRRMGGGNSGNPRMPRAHVDSGRGPDGAGCHISVDFGRVRGKETAFTRRHYRDRSCLAPGLTNSVEPPQNLVSSGHANPGATSAEGIQMGPGQPFQFTVDGKSAHRFSTKFCGSLALTRRNSIKSGGQSHAKIC